MLEEDQTKQFAAICLPVGSTMGCVECRHSRDLGRGGDDWVSLGELLAHGSNLRQVSLSFCFSISSDEPLCDFLM